MTRMKDAASLDERSRSPLDPHAVRPQFPSLRRVVDGRPVVFADAPGGTQVPDDVIRAMQAYLRRSNANTGGAFATSIETDELIANARVAGADLLGASPAEVVFGPNMTTLSFALSRAVARDVAPGDELVVTVLDHDANIAPWLSIAEDRGAAVRWVDATESDCTLDLASLERALTKRSRVVAFTLAANAVGTVSAAHEVVERVRAISPRALVVADAVHFAQHRLIDVRELDVDVVFCSAYKVFGPHLGLMWARTDVLERLRPYKVRPAPESPPDRWEWGTLNHEGLAGFIAAVDYLAALGHRAIANTEAGRRPAIVRAFEAIASHESTLAARFLQGAAAIPGLCLFGIAEQARLAERTPTFALRLGDLTPRQVAVALGDRGVFVWDGNYYALAIMERLGLERNGGAGRVGFCHYHPVEEVDRVLLELERVAASA